jgi:hypothetical protein
MPEGYDPGALIDDLEKLKLFRVEIRDHIAMRVPAELSDERSGPRRSRTSLSA